MQHIDLATLGLDFVKTCFSWYQNDMIVFGMFVLVMFAMYLSIRKPYQYLSYYVFFLFLTIFNPILVKYCYAPFDQDTVYYRFFWLLPINIVVAAAIISIAQKPTTKFAKTTIICCFILLISTSGTPQKSLGEIIKIPDNLYRVSDDLLEISEYVHQDFSSENPVVVAPTALSLSIRQYDASIHLAISRDMLLSWEGMSDFEALQSTNSYQKRKPILDVLLGGSTDTPDDFISALDQLKVNYIITDKFFDLTQYITSCGGTLIAETDSYLIYKYTA